MTPHYGRGAQLHMGVDAKEIRGERPSPRAQLHSPPPCSCASPLPYQRPALAAYPAARPFHAELPPDCLGLRPSGGTSRGGSRGGRLLLGPWPVCRAPRAKDWTPPSPEEHAAVLDAVADAYADLIWAEIARDVQAEAQTTEAAPAAWGCPLPVLTMTPTAAESPAKTAKTAAMSSRQHTATHHRRR